MPAPVCDDSKNQRCDCHCWNEKRFDKKCVPYYAYKITLGCWSIYHLYYVIIRHTITSLPSIRRRGFAGTVCQQKLNSQFSIADSCVSLCKLRTDVVVLGSSAFLCFICYIWFVLYSIWLQKKLEHGYHHLYAISIL